MFKSDLIFFFRFSFFQFAITTQLFIWFAISHFDKIQLSNFLKNKLNKDSEELPNLNVSLKQLNRNLLFQSNFKNLDEIKVFSLFFFNLFLGLILF